MRQKLNWKVLKALDDIYCNKQTKAKILDESYVQQHLISTRLIKPKFGNSKILELTPKYKSFYEKHFLDDIENYKSFFDKNEIPQTANQNYEEEEIEMLIELKQQLDNGDLDHIMQQVEEQGGESYHGVSLMFTKDEKYLDHGKDSLRNALKIILQTKIPSFKYVNEKDQQYIYKLTHPDPICIVLCENLDFLRKPSKPRENRIELWYAGGKNVGKLGYEPAPKVRIFYSCDWDWDGLDIFRLVKDKLPNIKLLNPQSSPVDRETTPKHKSEWRKPEEIDKISDLDETLFNESQKQRILNLKNSNSWLREEENYKYLIEMVNEAMKK